MAILFRPQGAFGWFSYTTSRDTIRTHVSAISKSANIARLSTVANAPWQIETLIVKPDGKSAVNWGTVGSTLSLPS